MIDTKTLERRLNIIRREHGLIGGRVKVTLIQDQNSRLRAAISLKNFNIEFEVHPEIEEIWNNEEPIKIYSREAGLEDVVKEVCNAVVRHEIWHWKKDDISGEIGCPTDTNNLAKIMDAAYSALDKKGIFRKITDEDKRKKLTAEMKDVFADIIVNSNLGYTDSSNGISVIYYDAGMSKQSYNMMTEGFFRIQMRVWGKEHDKKLLEIFYTKEREKAKKIEDVVDETLKAAGLKDVPLKEAITRFREPTNWPELAYKITWHLSDLIEDQEGSGEGDGSLEIPTIATEKDGKQQKQEGKEQDDKNEIPQIAESIDQDLTPETEREIVVVCYGQKAGPPNFLPKKRVLKLAYEHLAGKVEIRAKEQGEGFEMPITPIDHEPFNPSDHDIHDIDFSQPIIDPESVFPGNINFQVPNRHYTVSEPYTPKKERIPNIMFLFDCSGSMKDGEGRTMFNISDAWGEDSKYHYALLGAFGAIKWLRLSRIAPYLKYNVTLFSDTTRTSGWRRYNELEKALELFWTPEFGGTGIDMQVLKPQLAAEPSVIILLSDGGIWNWDSIKSNFRSQTRKHRLSYIQIRDKTSIGDDLKRWGNPVYDVENENDLDGLIIDLTKKSFERYAA